MAWEIINRAKIVQDNCDTSKYGVLVDDKVIELGGGSGGSGGGSTDGVLDTNGKLLNSVLPDALQFGEVPEYLSIINAEDTRVYNLGEEQYAAVLTTNNIPANTEITVVWDGVEYVRMSTETDDKIEVGDYDTDPFYICKYKNQTPTEVYSRDAGYHDFSIGYYVTVIKKIDDNFIPINIARKDDIPDWDSLGNKPFYEGYEDVVMFSGNYQANEFTGTSFIPVVFGNLPIKEDTTYKVIWDGVEYIRTSVMYNGKPVIGDYDSDPFFMINNGVSICLFSKNPGKHDVTVSYETYVMKQLDEKFIPDTIARVSDIPSGDSSGGSGGGFTATLFKTVFDEETEETVSSCNKTYAECLADYNNGNFIAAVFIQGFDNMDGYHPVTAIMNTDGRLSYWFTDVPGPCAYYYGQAHIDEDGNVDISWSNGE